MLKTEDFTHLYAESILPQLIIGLLKSSLLDRVKVEILSGSNLEKIQEILQSAVGELIEGVSSFSSRLLEEVEAELASRKD